MHCNHICKVATQKQKCKHKCNFVCGCTSKSDYKVHFHFVKWLESWVPDSVSPHKGTHHAFLTSTLIFSHGKRNISIAQRRIWTCFVHFLCLFYFSFPSFFLLSLPLPLLPLPLSFFLFLSLSFLFFSFFSSSPLSPTNTKKVPVEGPILWWLTFVHGRNLP